MSILKKDNPDPVKSVKEIHISPLSKGRNSKRNPKSTRSPQKTKQVPPKKSLSTSVKNIPVVLPPPTENIDISPPSIEEQVSATLEDHGSIGIVDKSIGLVEEEFPTPIHVEGSYGDEKSSKYNDTITTIPLHVEDTVEYDTSVDIEPKQDVDVEISTEKLVDKIVSHHHDVVTDVHSKELPSNLSKCDVDTSCEVYHESINTLELLKTPTKKPLDVITTECTVLTPVNREEDESASRSPSLSHVIVSKACKQVYILKQAIMTLCLLLVTPILDIHNSAWSALTFHHVAITVAYIYAYPFIVTSISDASLAAPFIWYIFLAWFFVNKHLNFAVFLPLVVIFDGGSYLI